MPVSYQFLPWVRRGLAVALDAPDTLGPLPARGRATVGVSLAGAAAGTEVAPLQLRLYGPGDVIGIDPTLVVRTDPRPGATNFEPNYLAIVDFDPPDFPWLLTPAHANGDDRLRPWLVLVVLDRAKVAAPKLQPGALLPAVKVAAADVATELPPLGESWSWAHAQVVSAAAPGDTAGLQRDLQGTPASNVSRLVCPRRLAPNVDYVACLVPAFEPGRLRGLGLVRPEDPAMETLAPAWSHPAAGDVTLPVYHHWSFSTGPAGDFESLARRLRTPGSYKGTPLEDELARIGTAPMRVDDLLNGSTPGLATTMEGALVPIRYRPGGPPAETQAESLAIIVNTPNEQVDNPVVDEADGSVRRLEVKAPLAGAWHAKQHTAPLPAPWPASDEAWREHTPWLAGLNLNPRYRGAAGHGYEVVRRNQEDYVDACWDQVGDIRAAELKFNLTRLAIETQRAIRRKHFEPLKPERLLQLMGPALARIEALDARGQPALRIGGQLASVRGQVDRSSLPAALTETALRRHASPNRPALRAAARRVDGLARLGSLGTRYFAQMAQATQRGDAFVVNRYVPDGILGTRLLDGVDLSLDDRTPVDLEGLGFGRRFGAGELKGLLTQGEQARKTFERRGAPALVPARDARGVIVDQHVSRFGELVSAAPGVRLADWVPVATRLDGLTREAQGALIEADIATGVLELRPLTLKAGGEIAIDERAVVRIGTVRQVIPRAALATPRPLAGTAGLVGRIQLPAGRLRPDPIGVVGSLPIDSISSGRLGEVRLRLDPDFRIIGERPPADRRPGVAGVAMPPPLVREDTLRRFEKATQQVQQLWADPLVGAKLEVQAVDFGVAQAAQIVRARTDPELTLPARLAATVSIANTAANAGNAFVGRYLAADAGARLQRFLVPRLADRVMAWPRLRDPMYQALAALDAEAFMPGVGNLPQDLVMLVQVNQFFVDAFMVGANAEMNRELLWRGFPTDLRGTPFQRFWGRLGVDAAGAALPLDDMQPIHQWGPQPLGLRRDPNLTDPNRVALLVRGQLLRRYPNTYVYAWKRNRSAGAAESQLLKVDGAPPAGAVERPSFGGFIPPDINFFGFDIDREQVGDWCFVLEEPMSEPRFGFDVDEPPAGGPGPTIGAKRRAVLAGALAEAAVRARPRGAPAFNLYKALSWSHLQVAAGGHVSVSALVAPPNLPFADFTTLSTTPTSAEIAKALLQEPFRAYFVGPDLAT